MSDLQESETFNRLCAIAAAKKREELRLERLKNNMLFRKYDKNRRKHFKGLAKTNSVNCYCGFQSSNNDYHNHRGGRLCMLIEKMKNDELIDPEKILNFETLIKCPGCSNQCTAQFFYSHAKNCFHKTKFDYLLRGELPEKLKRRIELQRLAKEKRTLAYKTARKKEEDALELLLEEDEL